MSVSSNKKAGVVWANNRNYEHRQDKVLGPCSMFSGGQIHWEASDSSAKACLFLHICVLFLATIIDESSSRYEAPGIYFSNDLFKIAVITNFQWPRGKSQCTYNGILILFKTAFKPTVFINISNGLDLIFFPLPLSIESWSRKDYTLVILTIVCCIPLLFPRSHPVRSLEKEQGLMSPWKGGGGNAAREVSSTWKGQGAPL